MRPFIHFPTPVRGRLLTKMLRTTTTSSLPEIATTITSPVSISAVTVTTTVTTTVNTADSVSNNLERIKNSSNDHEDANDYDNNNADEYYEGEAAELDEEHAPRSRNIREKDSQPLNDYEYPYAYQQPPPQQQQPPSQQQHQPPPPKILPFNSPIAYFPQPQHSQIPYGVNNQGSAIQIQLPYNNVNLNNNNNNNNRQNTNANWPSTASGATGRQRAPTSGGSFGQRVSAGQRNQFAQQQPAPAQYLQPQDIPRRFPEFNDFNTQIQHEPRLITEQPRVVPTPTRVRRPTSRTATVAKSFENDYHDENLSINPQGRFHSQNDARELGNNRNGRRRKVTTTTTSTTQRPIPLLPNRRRLNRKNLGRPRFSGSGSRDSELSEESFLRERNNNNNINGRRTQQRGRTTIYLNNQPTVSARTPQSFSSTNYISSATPALPKTPVTVTSIVNTTRTVPIYHGHRTSYATLTTTTLNSSVILPGQYETSIDPTNGLIKSIYTTITNTSDPLKVTYVLITTTELHEVKLIPYRIGFSTKTDTRTEMQTFPQLTTVVSTVPALVNVNPYYLQGPQIQYFPAGGGQISFTFLTTTNTIVKTETSTSTTVVSILLNGKTVLSTLTSTSLVTSTVTSAQTLSIPITQPAPVIPIRAQPITTMLTLYLTGDGGDVTELVTAVTVPVQPLYHTKVERDVKPTSSYPMQQTLLPDFRYADHSYFLAPSRGADFDNIATSFRTVDQIFKPTDTFFVTTIFKGSETEIYQAPASVVKEEKKEAAIENEPDNYAVHFRKRSLQQFGNENFGPLSFGPQPIRIKEFSRAKSQFHNSPSTLDVDQNDPIPDFSELENPALLQSLPHNLIQPNFQRIRVNGLPTSGAQQSNPQGQLNSPINPQSNGQNSPPQIFSTPNEAPLHRFQRITIPQRRPDNVTPIRIAPQSGFRRVPVFNNQLPQPQPPPQPVISITRNIEPQFVRDAFRPSVLQATPSIESPPESITVLPLPVNPTSDGRRQSFRRVRPNGNGSGNGNGNGSRRRPGVRISSRVPIAPTSTVFFESSEISLPLLIESDDIPRRIPITRKPGFESDNPSSIIPSPTLIAPSTQAVSKEVTTDQPKRTVRIRRPTAPSSATRKRVILRGRPAVNSLNELQGRGPVSAIDDEPTRNNALDIEEPILNTKFGSRFNENFDITKNEDSNLLTPTIPLTYYTTFTYLTTVVHGAHTAHISRESVTSTVATEALDGSIIDLIQNNQGYIVPSQVMKLGTKTKGHTTTIVNLKSKVHVFNDDLYKVIQPTKPVELTPTTSKSEHPLRFSSSSPSSPPEQSVPPTFLRIDDLQGLPKKFYTHYTYFYTIHDNQNTRHSTRAEIVTSTANEREPLSTVKLDTSINSNGFLSVGSGPETVHLGSRELAGTTTEVNLALNTYLHFDGISNAVVESVPTAVADSGLQPSTQHQPDADNTLRSAFLSSSFASAISSDPIFLTSSTPDLPSSPATSLTRKPVKLFSSAVIRDPLRSKLEAINGRPGVRVRVRPATSRFHFHKSSVVSDLAPSIDASSSDASFDASLSTPEIDHVSPTHLTRTPTLESKEFLITETKDKLKEVTPTKKRIAVTLRRPFAGNNRLSTRRPTRVQLSSKPRLVVVTRTGQVGLVKPTVSNRFKISSRVIKSSATGLQTTPTIETTSTTTDTITEIQPTVTFNENGETLSLTVLTVPVIFGIETSYRTVTYTSTVPPLATPTLQVSSPSGIQPTTAIVTYFTTTTHTIPFTVGDQTIYTTIEETNSRITTELLENFDASDAARANRFTRISNGITLIVASNAPEPTTTTPYTLQPTRLTGPAVVMKDGITFDKPAEDAAKTSLSLATLFDTRTLYTTFTYFTTFYTDDTSLVSSSEQTVSNVVTIPYTHIVPTSSLREDVPTVVLETSDRLRTRTVYSTLTYYATLFNGSTSSITPIEEIKTELITLREPITLTKTITPTTLTNELQSVLSEGRYSTYVFGADQGLSSEAPASHFISPIYATRSTYTTLTHYITLYSGNQTILSSIEEITPTVVTEPIRHTQANVAKPSLITSSRVKHRSSQGLVKSSRDLMSTLVPSISTLYTTLTYFTTFFSGSTSTIASREETTSSLVTVHVPESEFIRPTMTVPGGLATQSLISGSLSTLEGQQDRHRHTEQLEAPGDGRRTSSVRHIHPSLRVESSAAVLESKLISDVFESLQNNKELSEKQISSVIAEIGASSTVIDDSTIVLFTNFILPSEFTASKSHSRDVVPTKAQTGKGPAGDIISSLLDNSDISIFNGIIVSKVNRPAATLIRETLSPIYVPSSKAVPGTSDLGDFLGLTPIYVPQNQQGKPVPNAAKPGSTDLSELLGLSPIYVAPAPPPAESGNNPIKPSSVIELSDLLGGANIAGNIGEAIKDIVQIFAKQKNITDKIERVGPSKAMPPREGVTVSNLQDPIYIPLGAILKSSESSKEVGVDKNFEAFKNKRNLTLPIAGLNPILSFDKLDKLKEKVLENTQIRAPSGAKGVFVLPTRANSGQNKKDQVSSGFQDFDKLESINRDKANDVVLEPSIKSSLPGELITSTLTNRKSTPDLSSVKSSELSKSAVSKVSAGATVIFFTDANQNAPIFLSSNSTGSIESQSTKYITSVESITKTLTITQTKVYYTRDSPLTITSLITTTIPPRTFVSTIIGQKTILGTAGEPTEAIQPTQTQSNEQTSTTVTTTTTLIFNSITTTVVRTLVLPTTTQSTVTVSTTKTPSQRPTRRPPVPFRPPTRVRTLPTEGPSIKPAGSKTRGTLPPPRPPTLPPRPPNARPSMTPKLNAATISNTVPTTRAPIIDIDQCRPACNAANKEICKEFDGKYKCDCRPGFVRRDGSATCQEMQSYIVVIRVMKVGEAEVNFRDEFVDNATTEYKDFAKMAKDQIDKAYLTTEIKDNYIGANVMGINRVIDGGDGVFVNFTVHLTQRDDLDEELLRQELMKTFGNDAERLPNPQSIAADVEDVVDFDECKSDLSNDCATSAICINEPGSYRCQCKNGYPDLDPSFPGRVCAAEIKACDFCHGRGDCIRDDFGQVTTCKCHRMYLGRRCEINGLLLATLLPIAAILCIISICCIVYCCRRWRKRTISKGFRNIATFGPPVMGGTLDRKAMLETSSESSDHMRPHVFDGPGILPIDPNGSNESSQDRRRGSEPSLDRSMGSLGGAFHSMPPQIVIPRVRHPSHHQDELNENRVAGDNSNAKTKCKNLDAVNSREERDLLMYMETEKRCEVREGKLKNRSNFNGAKKRSQSNPSVNQANNTDNNRKETNQWTIVDDSTSIISGRSAFLVSPGPSSLRKGSHYQTQQGDGNHILNRHGWEWQLHPKYRYTKASRPGSESALTRNPVSEAGRSYDETVLFPPTQVLRNDLWYGRSRHLRSYKSRQTDESEVSYGRSIPVDDCFSYGSTMTSHQW